MTWRPTIDNKDAPASAIEADLLDGWSFRVEANYHPGECQERVYGIMKGQERAEAIAAEAIAIITNKPFTEPVCRVGVAAWLRNKDGHILMGKRKGSHGAGTWSLPGGHIEFGEHPCESVRRELKEECGLEVGDIVRTFRFPYGNRFFPEDNKHYITLFFDAEYLISRGPPMNLEPHKCDGWFWFPMDALPSPLFGALEDEEMIAFMKADNA